MGPDLALLPRFLLLFDKSFLLFIVEGIGPRDATTAGVEREFIEEDFPTHLHLPDHPALQARLQPGRFENEAAFALRASQRGGCDPERVAVGGEEQVEMGSASGRGSVGTDV